MVLSVSELKPLLISKRYRFGDGVSLSLSLFMHEEWQKLEASPFDLRFLDLDLAIL